MEAVSEHYLENTLQLVVFQLFHKIKQLCAFCSILAFGSLIIHMMFEFHYYFFNTMQYASQCMF
jgi:hypothetical protein